MFSHQFKHIISDIKIHGEVSKPRDLEVTELLYAGYEINPKEPLITVVKNNGMAIAIKYKSL